MRLAFWLSMMFATVAACADWKVTQGKNPEGPGQAVDAAFDGKIVARLVYGEKQLKPYLHVFGEPGELLTNSGADASGKGSGAFPHHRGIFIGWKVTSELGTDDLWHMTRGCKMEVAKIEKTEGGKDGAQIVAEILWKSGRSTNGSDLLLTERRVLNLSRPAAKQTQIDATFTLLPARDLRLAGDLQHSGVHFRASNEVHERKSETTYITEPHGQGKGADLKWCRLVFPIGSNWYSALQLNHPSNPVEELSTRDYGRFGYFFKKDLRKEQPLTLKYRFIIDAAASRPAQDQLDKFRTSSQKAYDEFARAR